MKTLPFPKFTLGEAKTVPDLKILPETLKDLVKSHVLVLGWMSPRQFMLSNFRFLPFNQLSPLHLQGIPLKLPATDMPLIFSNIGTGLRRCRNYYASELKAFVNAPCLPYGCI